MGFFFTLIGYLIAVALMVGGAVASAVWVTRPVPPPTEKAAVVTESAQRMHGANVALTKRHGAKRKSRDSRSRHASKQR